MRTEFVYGRRGSPGSVNLAVTASMPDDRLYGYAHLLTERMLLVHSPGDGNAGNTAFGCHTRFGSTDYL